MQIEPVFEKARQHVDMHSHATATYIYTKNQFHHISWNCLYIQNEHVYLLSLEIMETTAFVTHLKFSYLICACVCVRGETQPKKVPFNYFVVRLMLSAITTTTTAAATTPPRWSLLRCRKEQWNDHSLSEWDHFSQQADFYFISDVCVYVCVEATCDTH